MPLAQAVSTVMVLWQVEAFDDTILIVVCKTALDCIVTGKALVCIELAHSMQALDRLPLAIVSSSWHLDFSRQDQQADDSWPNGRYHHAARFNRIRRSLRCVMCLETITSRPQPGLRDLLFCHSCCSDRPCQLVPLVITLKRVQARSSILAYPSCRHL